MLTDLTEEWPAGTTEPVLEPAYPEPRAFPVRTCLKVIINEEWAHRTHAERDLDVFAAPAH